MWLNLALVVLLIVIAKERGLESIAEAIAFAVILFILLMGVFQFL